MLEFTEDYFEEEECEGFVITSMMKRAWAAQLEVLEEVKRVCEELNIKYFADFGTLLGAVRHQGFIPWDDDLDICMLRKDYIIFLDKAPELLEHWYEIKSVYNDPEFDIVKARIINGRHINFEKDYLEKFHYCPYVVGIDIFPVDNIPDEDKEVDIISQKLDFLLRVEASIPDEGPYDEDVLDIMKNIEKSFGVPICYENRMRHEVKKVYDILSASYVNQDTKQVGCMMAVAAKWNGYRYNRGIYDKSVDAKFENTMISIPQEFNDILTSYYGNDYMSPKKKESSHEYPFYKEQIKGMKEIMEKEFGQELTCEMVEQLIEMKAFFGE